jgi:hypothetical protein
MHTHTHIPCTGCLQVIEAGANALVAGNAVFKAKSYKDGECMSRERLQYRQIMVLDCNGVLLPV